LKDRVGLSLAVGSEGMCAGVSEAALWTSQSLRRPPALEHRPAAALYASCAVDSSRAGWCAVRDVGNGPRARRPHGPCRCRTVVGVADRRGAG
jgi:hypothetical protein